VSPLRLGPETLRIDTDQVEVANSTLSLAYPQLTPRDDLTTILQAELSSPASLSRAYTPHVTGRRDKDEINTQLCDSGDAGRGRYRVPGEVQRVEPWALPGFDALGMDAPRRRPWVAGGAGRMISRW
jgi:hypothetical protein